MGQAINEVLTELDRLGAEYRKQPSSGDWRSGGVRSQTYLRRASSADTVFDIEERWNTD